MDEKIVPVRILLEQNSLMPSGAWEVVWYTNGDGQHLGVKLDFNAELMHPKFFSPEQVIAKDGRLISRFDAFMEDFKAKFMELFLKEGE